MFEVARLALNEPLHVRGLTITVVGADAEGGTVTLALSAADGAATQPLTEGTLAHENNLAGRTLGPLLPRQDAARPA